MVESNFNSCFDIWNYAYFDSQKYSKLFKSRLDSFSSKQIDPQTSIFYSEEYTMNKRTPTIEPKTSLAPFKFNLVPAEVNLVIWDEPSEEDGPTSPAISDRSCHVLKSLTDLQEQGI